MRFLSVKIEGFRGLRGVDLDLRASEGSAEPLPLAVIVGPNGSGKTAVLEALVRASWLFAEGAANAGARPLVNELATGTSSAEIDIEIVTSSTEARSAALRNLRLPRTFAVRTRIVREVDGTREMVRDIPEYKASAEDPVWTDHFLTSASATLSPPSIVYFDAARYATRGAIRAVTAADEYDEAQLAAAPSTDSHRHLWTKQKIVNLKFAQLLDAERGGLSSGAFDRLWPAVHSVLKGVRFREITKDLRILFDGPAGPVEFDDLSSGEKSVILIFVDILLRKLDGAAVLIDEVELHLHPQWQHEILGAVRSILPTCQLIVTTQSPIVAESVKDAKYLFDMGRLWDR